MRILISNDDGIDAFGLSLLADLMRPFSNDITIIAPMDNRSGTGRSLSLKQDIHLADLGQGRYACSGTPADCVMLGLNVVMKDAPPDLVVSGINHGMNAAGLQFCQQGRFIDQGAARRVDEGSAVLHEL